MYLRFVRLLVRDGADAEFVAFYRERVIPALRATEGCRFAGLLTPWHGEDAHQSFTIWDTPEHADAYERGPLFERLSRESGALLSARAEWRVRLARDPEETIDPTAQRVVPSTGYVIGDSDSAGLPAGGRPIFVRIVSVRIDPAHRQEFEELYRHEVIPALKERHGCRGVLLAEGGAQANEILSLSLWDREEDSVRYEMSGEPERLTAQLKATFSRLYDWGLTLGGERDARTAAPQVSTYHLVQGQPFKNP
ncbi:MAG: antibiotic biosynthesis monooxygenase [Acidobacteriota bacterium]